MMYDDDRLRLIFTCCHPALAMRPLSGASPGTRLRRTRRLVFNEGYLASGPDTDWSQVALAAVDRLEEVGHYHAYHAPAPNYCAGWAAARSYARPTTKPSTWRATPPRPPT